MDSPPPTQSYDLRTIAGLLSVSLPTVVKAAVAYFHTALAELVCPLPLGEAGTCVQAVRIEAGETLVFDLVAAALMLYLLWPQISKVVQLQKIPPGSTAAVIPTGTNPVVVETNGLKGLVVGKVDPTLVRYTPIAGDAPQKDT
jgi:hypothetical protein